MKLTIEQFILLENYYLRHFPPHIPDEILQDYKTILEYKDIIKYTKPEKRILNYLLDTAIKKINNNQRFQRITFIKLIRWQWEKAFIDNVISDKLFFIFKSLITEVNETISWSLSVIIKDIELSQNNIEWLIDNYAISEHIRNRLLRYPKPNKAITIWCKERLQRKDLDERLSELIGLSLNFNIKFTHKDKTSLIWGIYYSKLSDNLKKELLLKHLTTDNFEELIKICERSNFIDIISQLYNDLDISSTL
ncbi:hypothetical protein [Chryseobacterium luteum]|uniref:Uncharacterized protein n=1 Tax=Chryseobacterium luteum TaxID=421531 RepID=A0A085Z0C3_9FLAO|nr:hypothetical protein [Chryseobacterium luteum]KFE97886.1 hypothetical protein IX38_19675 [Chryseobacterium luteum]